MVLLPYTVTSSLQVRAIHDLSEISEELLWKKKEITRQRCKYWKTTCSLYTPITVVLSRLTSLCTENVNIYSEVVKQTTK
jgi:hypothetical protein